MGYSCVRLVHKRLAQDRLTQPRDYFCLYNNQSAANFLFEPSSTRWYFHVGVLIRPLLPIESLLTHSPSTLSNR